MSQLTTESAHELDAHRRQLVDQAIQEVAHIATLPEITVKIIDLVEDPDSTAQDLHLIISNDPALCSRVLKVVNSAFYGLPGQIGSINRAIILLGLNAVKNIAIAASLAKLFRGGRLSPHFSARDLWMHSIGVAAGVKLLSDRIELGLPDEAFLGGLIHDIGIMVEMQALRTKLIEVLAHRHEAGGSFIAAEDKVIGANHQHFGQALCEKWKFPRSFAYVTGFHHRPLELEADSRTITTLVHVADILAARHELGYTGTVAGTEIDPQVLDELKITQQALEEISEQLPDAFMVTDQLLTG